MQARARILAICVLAVGCDSRLSTREALPVSSASDTSDTSTMCEADVEPVASDVVGSTDERAVELARPQSPLAPCDSGGCGMDPKMAEQTCDTKWGPKSNKPYKIPCSCGDDDNCTNSDCWSNCFRNQCRCGTSKGTPNGCDGVPPTPPDPMWGICTCMVHGIHNYWCCPGAGGPPNHTYDGWSCDDYCGPGGENPPKTCYGEVCGIRIKIPCCNSTPGW